MVDGGGCKMANPFHSTGSPIVDRMCRLQFTGNVIPAAWYRTITRDNGKPNLTAIIILSDVVYWYRPVEIRDELTGQLCGFRKKFKADILQRNYQQLADQFGISKREAVNAVVELEKIGVVRRVFRTVRKGGMRNSNVLFLELNVDVLIQLTYPENLSDAGYHFLKGELSPHKERGATSGCDRISQSNEAYLSFEGDTNTEITEENTDIEYPMTKGGDYRKWYGNNEYVVNWRNNGEEIKYWVTHNPKDPNTKHWSRRLFNTESYFKRVITWSGISSGAPSMRIADHSIFGSGAKAIVPEGKYEFYIAYLNSIVALMYLGALSPTLNYESGHIASLPVIISNDDRISNIVKENIKISKHDWDSFETSWDFQHHPLLRKVSTIAEAFDQWQVECDNRFNQLKANEEELNSIFIDIYGLQDELTPEVEDKDVTVRKADLGRDMRSFISYAVGCMFGRYSLDVDGLAYAGGEWDASKYASFTADKDNIIPICDDEYFEDDIVSLFVEFVKTVYGADTLDENLKFISDALGGKGQPKDVIRNYFLSDFYSDHCKIYQKRPIYWLFDSGKKNGFKALIYMHRYQPDSIARIRTDYVHEQQARYRTAIADLEQRIANASTGERVKLNKKLTTLQAQDTEIRTYEEKIHHLADQMISIDLDNGVKKNYAIFGTVLKKL